VGVAGTHCFRRNAPFRGPYFKPLRTYRQAALLHARWLHDNPRWCDARGLFGGPAPNSGGDGQLWFITFGAAWGGLVIHELSDDAVERAEALETVILVSDMWLANFAMGFLPDTYQGWIFDQWVCGTTWLDLYRITGDERYRAAVLRLAKNVAKSQHACGTWGDTDPGNGKIYLDEKTGLLAHGSAHHPSMQEFDPSSLLYFFGRVRKELKSEEFKPVEENAWKWLEANSLARFDWRRQGPGESTQTRQPWPTVPDCALHCFDYLALDLPGRPADMELMNDLLRWSEDRAANWLRPKDVDPHRTAKTKVFPYVDGARSTHLRLALAYAQLAKRTGSKLQRAKAEALANAALVAQNPVSGQINFDMNPIYQGSGDAGNRQEWAVMALLRLTQLWETEKGKKELKP